MMLYSEKVASVDKGAHARGAHRHAFRGVIVLDRLTPINEDNAASCCSGMGKPCVPLSADAKGIYGHASVRGDNRWRRAISLYSGRGS